MYELEAADRGNQQKQHLDPQGTLLGSQGPDAEVSCPGREEEIGPEGAKSPSLREQNDHGNTPSATSEGN